MTLTLPSSSQVEVDGVTQSVDHLEELDLVVRVTSREDRRLVLAAITPAGRLLVPIGREVIENIADQRITQVLTPREVNALTIALVKIVADTDEP